MIFILFIISRDHKRPMFEKIVELYIHFPQHFTDNVAAVLEYAVGVANGPVYWPLYTETFPWQAPSEGNLARNKRPSTIPFVSA
jgi:hypothetical protein